MLRPRIISIHAPREGGDEARERVTDLMEISIHAPARGATAGDRRDEAQGVDFNPRPREGGDASVSRWTPAIRTFQSTPPARGATAS